MPPARYPVHFTPEANAKLRELSGEHCNEIDIAAQWLLSRQPRKGIPFPDGFRALTFNPPSGRIILVYEFDEEAVFIVNVLRQSAE